MTGIIVGLGLLLIAIVYCIWRARSFYGWIIVILVFIFLALSNGAWHSFSVFQVALFEEFGWSRGDTAFGFTLYAIVFALTGLVIGFFYDSLGARRIIPLGALVTTLGLVATSRINSLWQFYIFFGVVTAAGSNGFGWLPSTATLSNWFVRERGAAVGLAASGVGVGILILIPLLQYLIDSVGWREAYMALALMIIVIVPPLAIAFLRQRPQDVGVLPDGALEPVVGKGGKSGSHLDEDSLVVDKEWVSKEWTLGKALKTSRFWLLFLGFAFSNIFTQSVLVHQVAYMVHAGHSKMLAASVAGMVGFVSVFGKFGFGAISDRIGREAAWNFGRLLGVMGIGALILGSDPKQVWALYAYAIVFGLGYGSTAPLIPVIAADVFQGRNFGKIYGALLVGTGSASGLGAWLGGFLFDLTDSYYGNLAIASIAALFAGWFVSAAGPGKVRRVAGQVRRRKVSAGL